MEREFDLGGVDFETSADSPFHEVGAYEALWIERDANYKPLAGRFARSPGGLPSDFVPRSQAYDCAVFVKAAAPRSRRRIIRRPGPRRGRVSRVAARRRPARRFALLPSLVGLDVLVLDRRGGHPQAFPRGGSRARARSSANSSPTGSPSPRGLTA